MNTNEDYYRYTDLDSLATSTYNQGISLDVQSQQQSGTGANEIHTDFKQYEDTSLVQDIREFDEPLPQMGVNHGKKTYKCNICGQDLTTYYKLQKHRSIHTGYNAYTCDICGRGFILKQNFQKHRRIHTGEKPYTCDVCGKTFSESGSLKSHN